MEGPEVETVHYNFDALNHSPTHPARARTDTFYVAGPPLAEDAGDPDPALPPSPLAAEELVLRTHTSPMQVRAMEAHPPPLYVVIPGRVYRPDSDATHTPQFHQIEGLAVDEDITLADLKGTLLAFARAVFGERARRAPAPALLPVHRAERRGRRVLLSLRRQGLPARRLALLVCARARAGWRCSAPARSTRTSTPTSPRPRPTRPGYDPEKVQGFAWGMGVERIAMLKHGVPDLRLYYENDLRFLEQF